MKTMIAAAVLSLISLQAFAAPELVDRSRQQETYDSNDVQDRAVRDARDAAVSAQVRDASDRTAVVDVMQIQAEADTLVKAANDNIAAGRCTSESCLLPAEMLANASYHPEVYDNDSQAGVVVQNIVNSANKYFVASGDLGSALSKAFNDNGVEEDQAVAACGTGR